MNARLVLEHLVERLPIEQFAIVDHGVDGTSAGDTRQRIGIQKH